MSETIDFFDLCKFQPKQMEAVKAVMGHTFTLYGGAAGGGKSYFLRWLAIMLLCYYAKQYKAQGVRIGLFCCDYPSLADRQLSHVQYEFPSWLGDLNLSSHEYRLKPRFGSGVLAFRNLDDPSKYLSSEFAAILIDELTENPRPTFDFLHMRRRWPGIEDTKFVGTTNPGGIGHAWVKKLWVDRDFNGEDFKPENFAFVKAKATDNKYLGAAYEAQLSQLPEKLRKAYRDGSWDIFAGQYFSEWDSAIHVKDPYEIPEGWVRIRCLDYGYEAPSACYWMAIDYDGNIHVYRELYKNHLNYKDLALLIEAMTPKSELIDYTVADTSMFAKSPGTGEDGSVTMANNGVSISPASKDRVPGWNLFRQYLKQKRIYFFKNCINAIRTIPSLAHDESKVEDVAKCSDDHAADAIRYGLMSLPPLPNREQPKIFNPYLTDKDSPWAEKEINMVDLYSL